MSNPLSVRRVMVQTIDAAGNPEGTPTFGVVASDDYTTAFADFDSLAALNEAVAQAPSILSVVDAGQFDEADHDRIGRDNYYGKDWAKSPQVECCACGKASRLDDAMEAGWFPSVCDGDTLLGHLCPACEAQVGLEDSDDRGDPVIVSRANFDKIKAGAS